MHFRSRTLRLGLLALLLLSAGCGKKDRGTPIFNGHNLNGWRAFKSQTNRFDDSKALPAQDSWIVENGELHLRNRGVNLVSNDSYSDFIIYTEWKRDVNGDSGLILREQIQVNISSQPAGSGGIHPNPPLSRQDNRAGEWNELVAQVQNGVVDVWLNGALVVREHKVNFKKRAAPIVIQGYSPNVTFRSIRVKPLEEVIVVKESKAS